MTPITEERYESAVPFRRYLQDVEENREMWQALYERARVPEEIVEEVESVGERYRLVALSQDWCGDSVNVLPVLARLSREASNLDELRILERDQNLDIMDDHLTDGSRAIPVVIVLDRDFQECGWWGPRPRELQEWVLEEGMELPKDERYKIVRRWHARDKGRSTLRELTDLLKDCVVPT